MSASTLLISCEHGGNTVPAVLAPRFAGQEALLASHRGYDPGALETAAVLAQAGEQTPVLATTISRLVVDCNRSLGHPGLFSVVTKALPPAERQRVLSDYYAPHRAAVTQAIATRIAAGLTVVHVASHSFTPILDGVERDCDVGLLYDPRRPVEKAFCRDWLRALHLLEPGLRLRRNYPYKGVADGFPTALRRHFAQGYCGVELEVNQQFVQDAPATFARLNTLLQQALRSALAFVAAEFPDCAPNTPRTKKFS